MLLQRIQAYTGYFRLVQVTSGYYSLLYVSIDYYRLLKIIKGYYRVLQVATFHYMLLPVTTSRLIKQTSDYGLNSLLQGIFEPFTGGAPSKNTLLCFTFKLVLYCH